MQRTMKHNNCWETSVPNTTCYCEWASRMYSNVSRNTNEVISMHCWPFGTF